MDMETVLTAGLTSTVVSSLVSFAMGYINHKRERAKDQFDRRVGDLEKVRRDMIALEREGPSFADAMMVPDPAEATALLRKTEKKLTDIIFLYDDNRVLFDKDFSARLEKKRAIFNEAAIRDMEIVKSPASADEKRSARILVLESAAAFCDDFKDVLDQQIKRIRQKL